MEVKNKWNGRQYTVVADLGKEVSLRRKDGSEFIVSKGLFNETYVPAKKEGK